MMQGQLSVASELYRDGEAEDSRSLFARSTQRYETLEPAFENRGVEPFEDSLGSLSTKARNGDEWGELQSSHDEAQGAIQSAMQGVDASLRDDVAFQSRVQLALLRQAVGEYDEAVEDGAFVDTAEYRSGLGHMRAARGLLEQHADLYRASGDGSYDELMAAYDTAMEAWPTVEVPETPAMSSGELSASTFKLEALLGEY
ncbi:hypothetical protein VO226_08900 [Halomonas elongata]|uniref:hypothetical protein n=1 Tax=Halomonas elongata TaxID=2746 RepID=UPI00186B65B3|nr:hypothetical protein [Halomonas elongata]MBW5800543.1 hypothetical protein [Halomonas elongata]WVI70065.1 hypothetical protein VO226_08900 [Halomonas elongata]